MPETKRYWEGEGVPIPPEAVPPLKHWVVVATVHVDAIDSEVARMVTGACLAVGAEGGEAAVTGWHVGEAIESAVH